MWGSVFGVWKEVGIGGGVWENMREVGEKRCGEVWGEVGECGKRYYSVMGCGESEKRCGEVCWGVGRK